QRPGGRMNRAERPMTLKENARLDTSQVRGGGGGRRRGGGGLAAGGGIGGGPILVLYLLFGGNLSGNGGGLGASGSAWDFSDGEVSAQGEGLSADFAHCQTGADANEYLDCRVIGTVNSVQAFWSQAWSEYELTDTVM